MNLPSLHNPEQNITASPLQLNQELIDRLVSEVPDAAKDAAKKNIPIIAKALQDEGILDSNVLAYALATVAHETDETFRPIEEIIKQSVKESV